MDLPSPFIETITGCFADAGRDWLERLPVTLAACRERWGLSEGTPASDLSYNYVEFAALPTGEAVVLKVGVPHPELFSEMETLRLWQGRRVVRLLDTDRDLGAFLMQRLQPGTMLRDVGDNREQTLVAASIMRDLVTPPPVDHGLHSFAGLVERAFRLTRTEWDPEGRMPRELIDQAQDAFESISGDESVLHGDLHHTNILLDDLAGWTAIDPKGVIGPQCLETGRFIRNQLPAEGQLEVVRERIDILSDHLGFPRSTIASAALVDCVLGHCWGLEEGALWPGWEEGLGLASDLGQMAY